MSIPSWAGLAALVSSIVVLVGLALRVLALGVIPGNRRPTSGMAWLLLILISPIPGFLVFLFLGRTRLGRVRHSRQREANEAIQSGTSEMVDPPLQDGDPAYVRSVVALNRRLGSLPAQAGNLVEVQPDYAGSIAQMVAAVSDAEEYVHVEFYIVAWDELTSPLLDAMTAAAARGVAVRLLFDHLGTRGLPGYRHLLTRLDGTDIDWRAMLPIQLLRGRFRRPDLRNHRKLLVVDGKVGFTGSQNLTEPGYNKPANHSAGREWIELMVRLRGPIVSALEVVFASDWYTETGKVLPIVAREAEDEPATDAARGVTCQLVPSGPGYVSENNLRLFTTLIYSATRRVSLTSPYFVPDESLLYAVTTAAQRGVDVELFVSEQADQFMVGHAQASYYTALLEAGVRIYLYPAPYILHSKHFTIDDDVAMIGSSNMDMRSFALNYEISLMMLGPEVVRRVRDVEDVYRRVSRQLLPDEWATRPARLRYVDNVMRLTAALQ